MYSFMVYYIKKTNHNKYDNKIYVYLLYSQNSKYEKKIKKPELLEVI